MKPKKPSKSDLLRVHIKWLKFAVENDYGKESLLRQIEDLKKFTHGNAGKKLAKERHSARKSEVRERVIELHCTTDLHNLEIAQAVNVAPKTVTDIIREFHDSQATWDAGLGAYW